MAHESYGFEIGDNDNWAFLATPGPVVSDRSHSGTYCYKAHASGGIVYRPNAQYGPGTQFDIWWQPGGVATDGSVIAGLDTSTQERYEFLVNVESSATDTVSLRYHDGTTETVLDSTSYEVTAENWYRLSLTWDADGTLTGVLSDASETTLVTLTGTDTTITDKRTYGFWSNNGNNHFDDIQTTTLAPQQTPIETFETDRLAYYTPYSNNNYSRSTTRSYDGSTSLWLDGFSGGATSVSGLGAYPGPGDFFEFHWYPAQLTGTFQVWYGYRDESNRYLVRHDIDSPTDELELGEKLGGTVSTSIDELPEQYQTDAGWYRTVVYWAPDDTHHAWVYNPAGQEIGHVSHAMGDTGGHGIGVYKSGGGDSVYLDAMTANPDRPTTVVSGFAAATTTPRTASGSLLEGTISATPAPATLSSTTATVETGRTATASAPNPLGAVSTDLVAYFNFDSAEKTTTIPNWRDRTTDGTRHGTVGDGAGVRHDAVSFPPVGTLSTNTRIQAPSLNLLGATNGGITVAAWVRPEKLNTNGVLYHSIVSSDSINTGYGLGYREDTNEWLFGRREFAVHQSGEPYTTDQWVHVVVRHTPTHNALFLDGELIFENTDGSPLTNFAETGLYIGNGADTRRWFEGAIDEVAIWKRDLSNAEIQSLYDGYVTGPDRTTIETTAFGALGSGEELSDGRALPAQLTATATTASGYGPATPRPAIHAPVVATATQARQSLGETDGTAIPVSVSATSRTAHGTGAGVHSATLSAATMTAGQASVHGNGAVGATAVSATVSAQTATPIGIQIDTVAKAPMRMHPHRATATGEQRPMHPTTSVHGYEIPDGGTEEWHTPLNTNFVELDTDTPLLRDETTLPSVASRDNLAMTRDSRLLRAFDGPVDIGTWQVLGGVGDPPTPTQPVFTQLALERTHLYDDESLRVPTDYSHVVAGPFSTDSGATVEIELGGELKIL